MRLNLSLYIAVSLPENWFPLHSAYKRYPKVIDNYLFNQSMINFAQCQ